MEPLRHDDSGRRASHPAPRAMRRRRRRVSAARDIAPGRLALACELARRSPSLARTLAGLVATLAALGVVLAIALVAPGRLTTGVAGALLGGAALLGRRHARSDRALRPRTRSAAGPSRQPDDPAA